MTMSFDRTAAPVRDMTADEIQMARAVAACPLLTKSQQKTTMRMLAVRSFTENRHISVQESTTLRACVLAFAVQLPAHIVAMANVPGGGR